MESKAAQSSFVYVTFIRTTPEKKRFIDGPIDWTTQPMMYRKAKARK